MVKPWRVILSAVVIFIAGAVTGAIGVRVYAPKVIHKTQVAPPLPVSQDRRADYLSKLDRELQLTPDQRLQVEAILKASQQRMKALWVQIEPNTKEEYHRTRKEISELLTPEQRERMKQMRRNRDRDRDRDRNKNEEKKLKSDPGENLPPKPEARLCHGNRKAC